MQIMFITFQQRTRLIKSSEERICRNDEGFLQSDIYCREIFLRERGS
jgi:hypothetical protein